MNPKHEITKIVLEAKGLVADEKRIKQTIPIWWVNPRRKEKENKLKKKEVAPRKEEARRAKTALPGLGRSAAH